MSWAAFYLACFAIGFLFSVLSFLSSALHFHLPHLGHDALGHVGHGPLGGHGPVAGNGASATAGGQEISPFNLATLAAFLAWFGGSGYLLTRYSSVWFALGLLLASGAGVAGASMVFLFLSKVLMAKDESMQISDYDMVGVLGRISSPIRENGTGELVYSQAGTRRTCGARSEDGAPLARGAEVVVTRYEKGIAYVRSWDEMAGEPYK